MTSQAAATTTMAKVRTLTFHLTAPHEEFLMFFQVCVMYHLQGFPFQVITQDGRSISVWAALQAREGYLRDRAFSHDDSFAVEQCNSYLKGLYETYNAMSRSCRKVIPGTVRTRIEAVFKDALANPATLEVADKELYSLCELLIAEKPKSASTLNLNQAYWDFNTAFVLYKLGEGGRKCRRKEYDEFLEFVISNYTQIGLFSE